MLTLGVIADTHIPDRAKKLHPQALETFREAKVAAILHAGDLSTRGMLNELREIAPVHVVRGNRDVLILSGLPLTQELEFEGVKIGMAHGHGTFGIYVSDLIRRVFIGPRKFSYFEERVLDTFPEADVVVMGHSHAAQNRRVGNQLLFNPGSPCIPNDNAPKPQQTVGLLHIDGKKARGKIVKLASMKL